MCKKFSRFVLRIGMGFILLWTGLQLLFLSKVMPAYYFEIFQSFSFIKPLYPNIMGWITLVMGALLIVGLLTRITAGVAAFYFLLNTLLTLIGVSKGYKLIPIDIALLFGSLALAITGSEFSLDQLFFKLIGKEKKEAKQEKEEDVIETTKKALGEKPIEEEFYEAPDETEAMFSSEKKKPKKKKAGKKPKKRPKPKKAVKVKAKAVKKAKSKKSVKKKNKK